MAEELRIDVRLKDLASAELKKIQSGVANFGRSALGTFRGITDAVFSFKGALAGLGIGLTVKGLVDLVKGTADEADELRDLSIQLGTTTEFLSELKFAAGQAGIELGTLETGLRTLQKNLGEVAATGRGEALVALERLGPEIQDLVDSGASLEETFLAVAKALRELPASERVFVASKLFGRGGGKILQFLEEDFDKASAAAKRFGLTLSRDAADNADKFNDALGELGGALKGLKNAVILPLLPEIQKLIEGVTESIVSNKGDILRAFADIIEGAGEMAQGIKNAIDTISDPGGKAADFFAEIGLHLGNDTEKIKAFEKAAKEAGRGVADSAKLAADKIREIAGAADFVGPKLEDAFTPMGPTLEQLGIEAGDFAAEIPHVVDEIESLEEATDRWVDALNEAGQAMADIQAARQDAFAGAEAAFEELTVASKEWGVATHDAILDIADSLTDNLTDGVMSLIDGTKDFKEAFRDTAKAILSDIAKIIVKTLILKAVQSSLGGVGGAFAKGAAFDRGNVVPYAGGGVVAGPMTFPMSRGRTGLMGEAGPEAVMPLRRGPGGRLGVEASGGGDTINITVNVQSKNEDPKKDAEFIAAVIQREMRTSAKFREGMRAA